MTTDPQELLESRGAGQIAHPGGTLLAHLRRVEARLGGWGARPALRLAGLCHAFYGTDGFATALGDPSDRTALSAVIGEEAEQLVYFYAGCDRAFTYSRLTGTTQTFRDRFTGTVANPPLHRRRDLAELTAANELDLADVNPEISAEYGSELLALFTSWHDLLSAPARRSVREILD